MKTLVLTVCLACLMASGANAAYRDCSEAAATEPCVDMQGLEELIEEVLADPSLAYPRGENDDAVSEGGTEN